MNIKVPREGTTEQSYSSILNKTGLNKVLLLRVLLLFWNYRYI
jgi:hypothetical protein